MSLVFAIVGIVVVTGAFWMAAGRLNADLPDAIHDLRPDQRAGEPSFDVVMRGSRMAAEDATLADLPAQIERLKGSPQP